MNEFALALGQRIKERRLAAMLTQASLAQKCNIFRNYLSNIECGKANPTLSVLLAIADHLEVPPWLLMHVDHQSGWKKIDDFYSLKPGQVWLFTPDDPK